MRCLLLMGLLCCAASACAGDSPYLLWDNGDFDADLAIGNGKGTDTYFGQIDMQVADDFGVPPPGWIIDEAHFEGLCLFGSLQVDYLTVEFFRDQGGLPEEQPWCGEETYSISVSDYYDPDWGYYHVDIDVLFGPFTLHPGIYWVKVQPYGLTGDWFYQGCTTLQWGEHCAVRDGPWGGAFGHDEWAHDYDYGVNFQLKTWIPEPAAFTAAAGTLLGIGGIALRREVVGRERR